MSVINDRYKKLKNIYSKLIENGFIEDGTTLNYDEIIKDLYYLNLLIFNTYKIFKSDISDEEMILKLAELKDPYSKPLFDKDIAKEVVKKHKKRIIEFYNKLYNGATDKKKVDTQEEHIRKIKEESKNMKGGYIGEEYYSDNKVKEHIKNEIEKLALDSPDSLEKLVSRYGPKVVTRLITNMPKIELDKLLDMSPRNFVKYIEKVYGLKGLIDIESLLDDIYSGVNGYDRWLDENKELLDMFKNGANMIYNFNKYIFDWIFFPIYSMENLPIVGTFIEIPLDVIGVMLDNSSLIVDPLSKAIPLGLNIITDMGSAIPGVGTVVSAVGLGTTIFQKPMEYMLQQGPNMIGMYLNLARKEFGLAYLSAMEIFPIFADLVDASVTNMFTLNKYLSKGVRFSGFFSNLVEQSRNISKPFLIQPQIMFQPKEIWDKAIYPNRYELPILKNIPFDTIEKYLPIFTELVTEGPKNVKDIMQHILNGNMNMTNALKQAKQLSLETYKTGTQLKDLVDKGTNKVKKELEKKTKEININSYNEKGKELNKVEIAKLKK